MSPEEALKERLDEARTCDCLECRGLVKMAAELEELRAALGKRQVPILGPRPLCPVCNQPMAPYCGARRDACGYKSSCSADPA